MADFEVKIQWSDGGPEEPRTVIMTDDKDRFEDTDVFYCLEDEAELEKLKETGALDFKVIEYECIREQ